MRRVPGAKTKQVPLVTYSFNQQMLKFQFEEKKQIFPHQYLGEKQLAFLKKEGLKVNELVHIIHTQNKQKNIREKGVGTKIERHNQKM